MVEVGKYTLESLTTGMYSDPKIVYREYIQNSVDSIENAISEGIIKADKSSIKIYVDAEEGSISIIDNGTGIRSGNAPNILLSIGNSTKRQEQNRGFRGIGRLGGLSYCDTLIFKTSYVGESVSTEVIFDCKLLRDLLSPGREDNLNLQSVIEKVTKIKMLPEEKEAHYFKVSMLDVDTSSELLDLGIIKEYLSEVAPVPYDSKKFLLTTDLKRFLASHNYELTEFNIYIGYDESDLKQIYKPNKYRFHSDRNKKTEDSIEELVTFAIDLDTTYSLLGWYGRCNWNGTLSDNTLLGMRIRLGNILIGDRRTMDTIFKERRFNGWVQGEIFVNTTGLVPNARRDDFEQNEIYYQMIEKLTSEVGDVITKEIRDASKARNNPDVRLLKEVDKITTKIDKLVDDGLYSQKDKEQLTEELKEAEKKLNRVSQKVPQVAEQKKDVAEKLAGIQAKVENTTNYKINNEISSEIDKKQKKILKIVFETLSEYLTREMVEMIYNGIMEKIQGNKRKR